MSSDAIHLTNAGKYNEAEAMTRDVIERAEQVIGIDHANFAHYRNCLAAILSRQDCFEEAIAEYCAVHELFRNLYGPDDRRSLRIMGLIASRLHDVNRHDEAIEVFEAMIEICRAVDTPDEEYIARIGSAIEMVKSAAVAEE